MAELIAIATVQEPWQLDALPASTKSMLKKVEERGSLRMDELKGARTAKEKGADARALETRLLVFGEDIHRSGRAREKDRDLGTLGLAQRVSHPGIADSGTSEG